MGTYLVITVVFFMVLSNSIQLAKKKRWNLSFFVVDQQDGAQVEKNETLEIKDGLVVLEQKTIF